MLGLEQAGWRAAASRAVSASARAGRPLGAHFPGTVAVFAHILTVLRPSQPSNPSPEEPSR